MSDQAQPPSDAQQPDEQPTSQAITVETLLKALQEGEINTEYALIEWSSNYTFLVAVEYEDLNIPAIYKPQKGERPLWDFPQGTLCHRERAAYLTSDALKWDIVPPTVLREATRGLGSVQFFIEHDPDYNYFAFDESLHPQLKRLCLFDVIVNNADRKGGHCIVDESGHLWGIDHGITFHTDIKLRTVIWDFAGTPIPEPLLTDLESLCEKLNDTNDAYRQNLDALLAAEEIDSLQQRIQHILETRHFPQPRQGTNYPWPPV